MIHVALPSIAVLIVMGMIVDVWIASGTAPKLICYGLTLVNPSIFLAAAMVLRRIVPLPALFSGVVAGALIAIFTKAWGCTMICRVVSIG